MEAAEPLWPLVVYFFAVLFVVAVMVGLPSLLGERPTKPQKGTPYESGIATSGSIRVRIDVKFYMNAMFFVVFDIEAAFLAAWAIGFWEVGWPGYVGATVFILTLLAALVYIWKMGALDLTAVARRRRDS